MSISSQNTHRFITITILEQLVLFLPLLQIIWELSGDVMKDRELSIVLSNWLLFVLVLIFLFLLPVNTPLLDMVNRKLVETHIDCANPFGDSTTSTTSTEESSTTTTTTATTTAEKIEETSTAATTTSTTEKAQETSTTTTEKAEEMSKATEAIATDTQEITAQSTDELEEETHDLGKRKPVKRRQKKPDVPYRPPKEEREL